MKLWQLVGHEIRHRKLNFVLSVIAVVLAVACTVGAVQLLDAQEQRARTEIAISETQTQQHVAKLEAKTAQEVKALDDEIRKITKAMGFNIYILPKDQNLAEFYSQDFAAKTMPQNYVDRLAESRDVMTINHLAPTLVRKLKWPETNRQIILIGGSGVVPFLHRDPKKPLIQPIPKGKMEVGSVLASELSLEPGKKTTLLGAEFEVARVRPQQGNTDDITVWINLEQAQNMLDMQGQINMIQALECNCASLDRLAEIENEISAILGDEVQIIETATKAIARAKTRTKVKKSGAATVAEVKSLGEENLEQVKSAGAARIDQYNRFAAVLVPLAMFAAGCWVALLSLSNVRQRQKEIGIWRAIGFRSRRIVAMFLGKAVVIGLIGGVAGVLVGMAATTSLVSRWNVADAAELAIESQSVNSAVLVLSALVLTPLLAVLATWLPALSAANQDPAVVLREE
jgi:hypothetical protein